MAKLEIYAELAEECTHHAVLTVKAMVE